MFALMAFLRVRTGAIRRLIDSHGVYVPGSASNVNCLLRDVFSPASGTGNNKHPLRQGTLFDCGEGLRRVWSPSECKLIGASRGSLGD